MSYRTVHPCGVSRKPAFTKVVFCSSPGILGIPAPTALLRLLFGENVFQQDHKLLGHTDMRRRQFEAYSCQSRMTFFTATIDSHSSPKGILTASSSHVRTFGHSDCTPRVSTPSRLTRATAYLRETHCGADFLSLARSGIYTIFDRATLPHRNSKERWNKVHDLRPFLFPETDRRSGFIRSGYMPSRIHDTGYFS